MDIITAAGGGLAGGALGAAFGALGSILNRGLGIFETRDPNWAVDAGAQAITEAISSDTRPDVLIVDGESMMPRFRHGEHLIFGRRYDDPTPLVGQEVMARLADGRKMVKILRRGAAPGLWTLESINTRFKPIEDVELLWALPFMGLRV